MSNPDEMSRGVSPALLGMRPFGPTAWAEAPERRGHPGGSTFVPLHGVWHVGWCWTSMAPLLRAAGRAAFTPTLPGLGERAHQLVPDVDLATHVLDVTAVLEYEDLLDVVLVGHSDGGMVVAGVGARAASRVARLVYLDAFLPDDGKAGSDYASRPSAQADGWRVPPPGTAQAFGVTNEPDAAWAAPRPGDRPLNTFTRPVLVLVGLEASRQVFIRCSETPWFAEVAERANRRGYEYQSLLSAVHDAMLSQPQALAAILTACARARRS